MLDPNREVAPEYWNYRVETKSGDVLREEPTPMAGADPVDVDEERGTVSPMASDEFRESGGGEVEGALGDVGRTGFEI